MVQSCSPNSCLHMGICLKTNGNEYSCNCTGTLYTGDKCEIGLIQISPVPVVQPHEQLVTLRIKAFPTSKLTFFITSPEFKSFKQTVVMNANEREASFSISTTRLNVYVFSLTYNYQYDGNGIFKPPDTSVIMVNPIISDFAAGASDNYFKQLQSPSPYLKPGCCFYDYSFNAFSSCSSSINFTSSCSWDDSGPDVSTTGVVFINNQGLYLPLSIAGAKITESSTSVTNSISPYDTCLSCSQCSQCFIHESSSCSRETFPFTPSTVEPLLNERSLLSTFFQQTSSFFPSYININVSSSGSSGQPFYVYDYMYRLISVTEVGDIYGCEKLPLPTAGLTYIARSRTDLAINIVNRPFGYKTSESDSFPICYSIDMCNGDLSTVHISIPESMNNFISSLPYFQPYISKRWTLDFQYLSFSSNRFSVDFSKNLFWNGSGFTALDNVLYDSRFNVSMAGSLSGSNLVIEIDFFGLFYYNRNTINNEVYSIL